MKFFIIFAIASTLILGFSPIFAEPEIQTLPTDKETLDVRLTLDEIIPGELTTLEIDFLNPQTQEIQPHIDWSFSVSKEGQIIWGPTQLSHTSEGSLKNLRYEFEEKGNYNLEFSVEGILFQIIPTEKVTFQVTVGETALTPPVSIDAHTSKNFYDYGESIGVNGKIKNYDEKIHSDLILEYRVLDPDGVIVSKGQTVASIFGAFSFSFVARGENFEPGGNFSIQLSFGSAESELAMYLSAGQDIIVDTTSPVILEQENIEVAAQTSDALTAITFEVFATDNVDKTIKPICKPESGYLFGIGETVVKCTAKDSAGNFAIPITFSVIVNPPITLIPSWVKNVAEFWCQDKIDDSSFVEGIQYLIDNDIIVIPAVSERISETQDVPQWVKNNACWWSEGSITDNDFALGIEYLIKQGIIVV